MSPYHSRPSEEQWLRHRALIRLWYLVDELPLDTVIFQLGLLGFEITKSQLEHKLKTWKFRKNLNEKTWQNIGRCISQRTKRGKETEVIVCGRRLKRATVEKETYRHLCLSDQFAPEQPLLSGFSTDTQVSVCTPQPISVEFDWPATLPWFRFPMKELRIVLSGHVRKGSNHGPIYPGALILAMPRRMFQLEGNISQSSISKLANIIGISMPESYPEENLQRAQCLSSTLREERLYESLSILIYSISNNIYDLNKEDQWQAAMAILHDSGLLKIPISLERLKSSTIDGFIDNLGNAAMQRLFNKNADDREIMDVIKWLLALAQRPITPSRDFWCRFSDRYRLHIQLSVGDFAYAELRVLELMGYLSKVCVDADDALKSTFDYDNSGWLAILKTVFHPDRSDDFVCHMTYHLLDHLPSICLDHALLRAIRRKKKRLIDMILQHGGSLNMELECGDDFVNKSSPLSVAAATGLSETQYILEKLMLHYPSKAIAEFLTPTVVILAAAAGQDKVLHFFHTNFGIVSADEYGVTPLYAAASRGYLSTCRLLYPLYSSYITEVTPTFSPFHAACYACHRDIIQFFITKGANINAIARYSPLEENLRRVCNKNSTLLKPLDCVFLRYSCTPITETSQEYDVHCATLLIQSGADLTGSEITIAAWNLDPELLSLALAAGADPNKPIQQYVFARHSQPKVSPLKRVLQCSSKSYNYKNLYQIVALLLHNGARLRGGEVAAAIIHGNWDLVDLVLQHGGSLLDVDEFGRTALEAAIHLGIPVPRLSQIFEAAPGIYDAGLLCAAITTGQSTIVEQLLINRRIKQVDHGLEVMAIGIAAESGNIDLLRNLLKRPPSREVGRIPLFSSSTYSGFKNGCVLQRQQYRRLQYNPFQMPAYLWGSPFAVLATKEFDEAVKAASELLKNGFQPDKLTWSVAARSNNFDFAQFLFDHGHRYENAYEHGNRNFVEHNPLVAAAYHHNGKLADLLLRSGVDVNEHKTRVEESRSPLQAAVENGDLDMIHCFVKAGANVNGPPAFRSGATALQLAAIKGYIGIAKYLIDLEAQVNALPARESGRTALEGAAEWGRLDMLELLLSSGAQKILRNGHPQYVRAVKFAIEEGYFVAANLLKQALGWSEEDESLFQDQDVEHDWINPEPEDVSDNDSDSEYDMSEEIDAEESIMSEMNIEGDGVGDDEEISASEMDIEGDGVEDDEVTSFFSNGPPPNPFAYEGVDFS
ncbi:ankyrin repeat-containing domain protein [Nemania sp. FL0916]|nr:ankyrin repeat-containing domain protein [Nemania sp. FL0916]